MPAAVMTTNLNLSDISVDQDLVDRYLERIDRFAKNVEKLGKTLSDLMRHEPIVSDKETMTYQEATADAPVQNVVTADDIDIDQLLNGIDLGGISL